MTMVSVSETLLFVSFVAYLVATFLFGGAVKSSAASARKSYKRWGNLAIIVTIIGFVANLGYFITRWIAAGHAPVSNLFEFTTAFGMLVVGAFILIYFISQKPFFLNKIANIYRYFSYFVFNFSTKFMSLDLIFNNFDNIRDIIENFNYDEITTLMNKYN